MYQAQERIPEMFGEDGNPFQISEIRNAAKVLDKQPDIGDDSLEYLFYSQVVCWLILFWYLFYINNKINRKR